jgi:hypothetical protein
MPKRKDAATVQVGLRIREPLRAQIERDAAALGVSMNALMADRLERSFDFPAMARLRYGRLDAAIIALVERALAFGRVNSQADLSEWIEDPTAFDFAIRAINRILDGLRPPGDVEGRRQRVDGVDVNPEGWADRELLQLGNEDERLISAGRAAEIRNDLGLAGAARLIERRRTALQQ